MQEMQRGATELANHVCSPACDEMSPVQLHVAEPESRTVEVSSTNCHEYEPS
jgi:hypothetical protein